MTNVKKYPFVNQYIKDTLTHFSEVWQFISLLEKERTFKGYVLKNFYTKVAQINKENNISKSHSDAINNAGYVFYPVYTRRNIGVNTVFSAFTTAISKTCYSVNCPLSTLIILVQKGSSAVPRTGVHFSSIKSGADHAVADVIVIIRIPTLFRWHNGNFCLMKDVCAKCCLIPAFPPTYGESNSIVLVYINITCKYSFEARTEILKVAERGSI